MKLITIGRKTQEVLDNLEEGDELVISLLGGDDIIFPITSDLPVSHWEFKIVEGVLYWSNGWARLNDISSFRIEVE